MNYLQDKRLTWKAKGLLSFLIDKNSDFYKKDLVRESKDGYEGMNSGLDELIKFGYLQERMIRSSDGKFEGYKYNYSSVPKFI